MRNLVVRHRCRCWSPSHSAKSSAPATGYWRQCTTSHPARPLPRRPTTLRLPTRRRRPPPPTPRTPAGADGCNASHPTHEPRHTSPGCSGNASPGTASPASPDTSTSGVFLAHPAPTRTASPRNRRRLDAPHCRRHPGEPALHRTVGLESPSHPHRRPNIDAGTIRHGGASGTRHRTGLHFRTADPSGPTNQRRLNSSVRSRRLDPLRRVRQTAELALEPRATDLPPPSLPHQHPAGGPAAAEDALYPRRLARRPEQPENL